MEWKNTVTKLDNKGTELRLNPPADVKAIAMAQAILHVKFPDELFEFYKETDGLSETMEGVKISNLIWSIDTLMEENSSYRTNQDFKELYMPFDCLLFFGDLGNGDNFGYSLHNKMIRTTDIYVWNHEDDSRMWAAPNLETFIEWWKSGKIKV